MKILLGVHQYPPDNMGGVELVTARLARWLVPHGHEVEVVCVGDIYGTGEPMAQTTVQDGVLVHRLALDLSGRPEGLGVRFRDDALAAWFSAYLERTRPDLFHCQSGYLLSASTIETARRAGIPTLVTLHDYWFFCPRITLLRSDGVPCTGRPTPADCATCLMQERRRYRLLGEVGRRVGGLIGQEARNSAGMYPGAWWPLDTGLRDQLAERQTYLDGALRAANLVLTLAPMTHSLLLERGFPPDRVRLVRNGLDRSTWRGRPRQPRSGPLRVGYMGQLAPHKGIHLLVQAARGLPEGSVEVRLHGDPRHTPGYVARLRRLAGDSPAIQFRGSYANADVEEVLAGLDVLVMPSVWYEVGPLVILEAQAAGVPVIASRFPNIAYQVRDGEDGLLFTPNDADDLARQLQRLLDEPGLLERLSGTKREIPSFEMTMAELEAIYAELIGGAPELAHRPATTGAAAG